MFKRFFYSALFLLMGIFSYYPALAARLQPVGPQNITGSPVETPLEVEMIIYRIIGYVYTFFFLAAVLFILLAAYNFVWGGSDEKRLVTAKSQLKYAVIAIVVALMASGISIIIDNFLLEGTGQMRFFLF